MIDRWEFRFLPFRLRWRVKKLLKEKEFHDVVIAPTSRHHDVVRWTCEEKVVITLKGRRLDEPWKVLFVWLPDFIYDKIREERERRKTEEAIREYLSPWVIAREIPPHQNLIVDMENYLTPVRPSDYGVLPPKWRDKVPTPLRKSIEGYLKRHPDFEVIVLYVGSKVRVGNLCWEGVGGEVHTVQWAVISGSIKLKQDLSLDTYPVADPLSWKDNFAILDSVGSSVALTHRVMKDGEVVKEFKRLYVAVPYPLPLRLKLFAQHACCPHYPPKTRK